MEGQIVDFNFFLPKFNNSSIIINIISLALLNFSVKIVKIAVINF